MNKTVIALVVIVLLVIGGFVLFNKQGNDNAKGQDSTTSTSGELKEFRVEAFQFGFDPEVIEVNQGDRVRIIALSRDVPHGLSIPEFDVNLYLNGLQEQTAEFVADKKGTFSFSCSVPCGSGHGSMNGQLIVR